MGTENNQLTTRPSFGGAVAPRATPQQRWNRLVESDRQILLNLAAFKTVKEIAQLNHVPAGTINGRIAQILAKIDLKSPEEIPNFVARLLLAPEEQAVISARDTPGLKTLTEDERGIADALTEGLSRAAITKELKISRAEYNDRVASIKSKIGVLTENEIAALVILEQVQDRYTKMMSHPDIKTGSSPDGVVPPEQR